MRVTKRNINLAKDGRPPEYKSPARLQRTTTLEGPWQGGAECVWVLDRTLSTCVPSPHRSGRLEPPRAGQQGQFRQSPPAILGDLGHKRDRSCEMPSVTLHPDLN